MSILGDIFGGSEESSSTTTRELAPPTAEEMKLLTSQMQLAERQLKALSQLGTFTAEVFSQYLPQLQQTQKFAGQMNAITGKELKFANQAVGAQGQLLAGELAAIKQGVSLTPDQEKLISEAANHAISAGLSDISNFRDESLRSLAQETAPARGLRPNDTPILDVGGRIVNEAQRSASDYVSGVRSQEANARLQYPIQAGQYMAERTQAQQQITGGVAQFQEQLRQEAFNNRLRLTALTGQTGATNAAFGASPSTLAGLQQLRLGSAPTTQEGSSESFDPMAALGGIGALMSGLGAMGVGGAGAAGAAGAGMAFSNPAALGLAVSDPDAKTDIRLVGDIKGIPLYKFRYKGDRAEHVGVMADEVPVEYVIHNPGGYDMVQYGQLLHDL